MKSCIRIWQCGWWIEVYVGYGNRKKQWYTGPYFLEIIFTLRESKGWDKLQAGYSGKFHVWHVRRENGHLCRGLPIPETLREWEVTFRALSPISHCFFSLRKSNSLQQRKWLPDSCLQIWLKGNLNFIFKHCFPEWTISLR